MSRPTVKLLILDEEDRLLLIHSRDPKSRDECWYPVGGGLEQGETLQQAAVREAAEETGIKELPTGHPVWSRDHTYTYNGREVEVHEDWLLHRVINFRPAPAALTKYERSSILGFRWWSIPELRSTTETVSPPGLGQRLADLLHSGVPSTPIDISE
ncbi:NUDIX hydrolase [Terrabacter aerolatus]|uniref:NUDIX hydrolase n=1 Tax=Terrabacter aerolatus TaxID=422442 RepID=UPI001649CF3D|nr:NUDIX domain-containing protein [Terrabacter aerolatus]